MCLREACVFCLQCLFGKKIELCLIGLQNAGKTTFVNVIATGDYCEDMIPTVGLNIREFIKDDVEIKCWDLGGQPKIKCWDLGGQPRFRDIWHRYCGSATVSAIVYVVDAADHGNLSISKIELHYLLSQSLPKDIPLLVLGNKIDKPGALSEQALIDQMGLESISDREVCCFTISCKNKTNIDIVIDWLIQHSKIFLE